MLTGKVSSHFEEMMNHIITVNTDVDSKGMWQEANRLVHDVNLCGYPQLCVKQWYNNYTREFTITRLSVQE